MPAFFSRRYVRRTESLGRVEKTLAVVLPLALVPIIILFIRQSVTDTNYLFNAESDDAPASAGTMTAGPAATPASSAKAAPAVAAAPADAGGKNPFPAPGVDG